MLGTKGDEITLGWSMFCLVIRWCCENDILNPALIQETYFNASQGMSIYQAKAYCQAINGKPNCSKHGGSDMICKNLNFHGSNLLHHNCSDPNLEDSYNNINLRNNKYARGYQLILYPGYFDTGLSCEVNEMVTPFVSREMIFVTKLLTWEEARDYCITTYDGGQLACLGERDAVPDITIPRRAWTIQIGCGKNGKIIRNAAVVCESYKCRTDVVLPTQKAIFFCAIPLETEQVTKEDGNTFGWSMFCLALRWCCETFLTDPTIISTSNFDPSQTMTFLQAVTYCHDLKGKPFCSNGITDFCEKISFEDLNFFTSKIPNCSQFELRKNVQLQKNENGQGFRLIDVFPNNETKIASGLHCEFNDLEKEKPKIVPRDLYLIADLFSWEDARDYCTSKYDGGQLACLSERDTERIFSDFEGSVILLWTSGTKCDQIGPMSSPTILLLKRSFQSRSFVYVYHYKLDAQFYCAIQQKETIPITIETSSCTTESMLNVNFQSTTVSLTTEMKEQPFFDKTTKIVCCNETKSRGLTWKYNCDGKVVQKCPGDDIGNAVWFCDSTNGKWIPRTPDLSGCRSKSVDKLLNSLNTSDVTVMYSTFLNAASQANTGGDIISITDVMKNVTSLLVKDGNLTSNEWLDVVENVTDSVTDTMNTFLNSTEKWTDLQEKDRVTTAESLLDTFNSVGFALIHAMNDTAESTRTVIKGKVLLQAIKHEKGWYEDQDLVLPLDVTTNRESSLTLKSGFENDIPGMDSSNSTFVLFTSLQNMQEVLLARHGSSLPNHTDRTKVNSAVLNINLVENETISIQLSKNVIFIVTHKNLSSENPVCAFWNFHIKNWDIEGCSIVDSNLTHTTCACDHLTNFAVLMDVHGVLDGMSESNKMNLKVITFVGSVVSIVALAICILLTTFFKQLWCIRNMIHRNLSICLLISEIILLVGLDRTQNIVLCSIIAGLMHYFFLAAFFWMFLESVYIYILLCVVFQPRRPFTERYYLCGYGMPLIIVGISAAINPKSYGTNKNCWLSVDNGMIWSFTGPVLVIITINFIALFYTLWTAVVVSKKATDNKKAARKWIYGALTLIPLLGLTWSFGFLFWKDSSFTGAYVFTILNSLQGLAIFVVQVAMNKKIVDLIQWTMLSLCKRIKPKPKPRSVSQSNSNPRTAPTSDIGSSRRASIQTTSTFCAETPILILRGIGTTINKSLSRSRSYDLNNESRGSQQSVGSNGVGFVNLPDVLRRNDNETTDSSVV